MDRITELDDRIYSLDQRTGLEHTQTWDAIGEIRRAINRLEDQHGVRPTAWAVHNFQPRHPDADPDSGV
jgi:hypothetical protein